MIVTALPDLPPAPETTANAAFRRWFYARWGHENAVICGRSRAAEYASLRQRLSIKTAVGGRERYVFERREVVVDDDNFLVLNDGDTYGSVLKSSRQPVASFSIFFRPGMQEDVLRARARSLEHAFDLEPSRAPEFRFSEHLRPHGGVVTTRVRKIQDRIAAGERDEDWLEEELLLLLDALLGAESIGQSVVHRLDAARATTRRELARRLRLGADYIESCHTEAITLADMARAACLSRFHFVRHFRQMYGVTPHQYLTRKRARTAARLLGSGRLDRASVATESGFGSRWALQRALARHRGMH